MHVHPFECVRLSVTLPHVVESFLSADDRVDFSCEWMKGLSYDGVHMQVPSLTTNGAALTLYHY